MKRTAFAVFALMMTMTGTSVAQNSPIQIGVDVGVAVSKITADDDEGSSSRKTPYGGVSLVIHKPGAKVGFQTGLLLVPKGVEFNDEDGRGGLEINYVEVPLLLRLALPLQGSKVVPSVLLGGSVGIKNSCNIAVESGSISTTIGCDDSFFEGDLDVKTIDVGVSGGVEVAIPIAKRFFLAPTVRYTKGLTNIGKSSDEGDAKNNTFQIGATFRIRM